MPEAKRAARFQIHLSTAIVLMFVAGGLIWANVREHDYIFEPHEGEFARSGEIIYWSDYQHVERGWPFNAAQTQTKAYTWPNGKIALSDASTVLRTWPLILNALVALAILFAVWFLCEWLIRRRARK